MLTVYDVFTYVMHLFIYLWHIDHTFVSTTATQQLSHDEASTSNIQTSKVPRQPHNTDALCKFTCFVYF